MMSFELKRKVTTIVLALFLASCNLMSPYKFRDISEFNLVPSALEENEEIKLIYSSRGPDYNEDLKYFYHIIVVSQKTGDTVNVLTAAFNSFNIESPEGTYQFFDINHDITRMMMSENAMKVENVKELKPKVITKVARDPKFDDIALNNYPTVIGSIGKNTTANE